MAAGVTMLVIASPTVRRQTLGLRLVNSAVGLGFLIYGIYLAFFFNGGHYIIFFQAFILPVVLIARTIGAAKSRPAAASQAAVPESTN